MASLSDSPQFGSVVDRRASDRRVWFFVVPGVILLGAVLVAAGVAMSRVSGLQTQVRLAQQQAAEAQKSVDERDKLLQKARADEEVLRSAGQGAAVLAAPKPDAPASGVAFYHPARHAVKVYAFGLAAPQQGQEYRVEVVTADGARTALGALAPDDRGSAFFLAREVPEGATELAVRLAPASEKQKEGAGGQPPLQEVTEKGATPEGDLVMAGKLPPPGTAGVMEAAPVQARSPRRAR